MSFFADKVVSEGLTFEDLLLIPSYSDVLPRDVELSSWFSRPIRLNMLRFVADWGIRYLGDIVKAAAAGANSIMTARCLQAMRYPLRNGLMPYLIFTQSYEIQ